MLVKSQSANQRRNLPAKVAAFLATAIALGLLNASSLRAQDAELRLPVLQSMSAQEATTLSPVAELTTSQDSPVETVNPQVGDLQDTSDSKPEVSSEVAGSLGAGYLSLADVIASVYQSYPEVNQAREEVNRTLGDAISADGTYDLKLKGYSLSLIHI